MKGRIALVSLFLLGSGAAGVSPAYAQLEQSRFVGTVTDQQGAVLPGRFWRAGVFSDRLLCS